MSAVRGAVYDNQLERVMGKVMRLEYYWYKFTRWLTADGMPVTKLIILVNGVTFLGCSLFHLDWISGVLSFNYMLVSYQPWTFLTYPLVGMMGGILSLFFGCYWLWIAGGSLERSWGSRRYAVFFFGISAASAVGVYVGAFIARVPTLLLEGLWMPLAGVTVAFGMLNPESQALLGFLIPIKLKYLALLSAVLVFISFGQTSLIWGVFSLAGCGVAYWYARTPAWAFSTRSRNQWDVLGIRTGSRGRGFFNPIAWYREWRERKRLKDLFDRSGFDE